MLCFKVDFFTSNSAGFVGRGVMCFASKHRILSLRHWLPRMWPSKWTSITVFIHSKLVLYFSLITYVTSSKLGNIYICLNESIATRGQSFTVFPKWCRGWEKVEQSATKKLMLPTNTNIIYINIYGSFSIKIESGTVTN